MAQPAPTTTPAPASALLDGATFKEVVGLDDHDMAAIYSLAYVQYEQSRFAEAEKTFRVLCFHDHKNPRYWLGLGAARQQLKDYEGAIAAYSMLAENGGTDPYAPLYAAECYLALGLFEEAISGLEVALDWAVHAEDPQAVIRHVEVLYTALEQLAEAAAKGAESDAPAPASAGNVG
ncbi:MAG TPA: SycD/LcrH family type III secretion system chaperone [Geminicoccaceae bacterium]|nr:SycD/LcrH family type III secretion system chaperone [Geminicoccaceae bacterium]